MKKTKYLCITNKEIAKNEAFIIVYFIKFSVVLKVTIFIHNRQTKPKKKYAKKATSQVAFEKKDYQQIIFKSLKQLHSNLLYHSVHKA